MFPSYHFCFLRTGVRRAAIGRCVNKQSKFHAVPVRNNNQRRNIKISTCSLLPPRILKSCLKNREIMRVNGNKTNIYRHTNSLHTHTHTHTHTHIYIYIYIYILKINIIIYVYTEITILKFDCHFFQTFNADLRDLVALLRLNWSVYTPNLHASL